MPASDAMAINVTHVVHSVSRAGAGVGATVCSIVNEQARQPLSTLAGGRVRVMALRDEYAELDLVNWPTGSVTLFDGLPPARYGFSPDLRRQLNKVVAAPNSMVHLHGLWQFMSVAAAGAARRHRCPLIVSVHGMLETWAFSRNPWLKRPLWLLHEKAMLQAATAIHVTSQSEAEAVRQRGITTPLAVVPLGVDEPPASTVSLATGPRQVLFLSRLHPKKGLLELIRAWARLADQSAANGWELVIAGPDEVGMRAQAESLVASLGVASRVRFAGELTGSAKWLQYQQASLFILPSFSENFGLVIPEAMACGLPVITTTATPWAPLEAAGCGWIVEPGEAGAHHALQEALSLDEGALATMADAARQFAARYRWPTTACKLGEVYQWAHAIHGPAPLANPEGMILD